MAWTWERRWPRSSDWNIHRWIFKGLLFNEYSVAYSLLKWANIEYSWIFILLEAVEPFQIRKVPTASNNGAVGAKGLWIFMNIQWIFMNIHEKNSRFCERWIFQSLYFAVARDEMPSTKRQSRDQSPENSEKLRESRSFSDHTMAFHHLFLELTEDHHLTARGANWRLLHYCSSLAAIRN